MLQLGLSSLFRTQALQPRVEGGQSGQTPEERAKAVLDDLLERLPELFDLEDIRSRIDELTPYIMVAIQVSWPRCWADVMALWMC